jgi:hypothetical protein
VSTTDGPTRLLALAAEQLAIAQEQLALAVAALARLDLLVASLGEVS